MTRHLLVTILLLTCLCRSYGQTYLPIAIKGYTIDAFANSGTDATASTTAGLDIQQKVLYTNNFATLNSLPGGVPDNGTIVNGLRTYQLYDYDSLNAIFLSANAIAAGSTTTGTFTLNTPAAYAKISLLAWSTEQWSSFNVTLHFSNGSDVIAGIFTVADWFAGTGPVIASLGRIVRMPSGPYISDGISSGDPRMYPVDIVIPCDHQQLLLSGVTLDYVVGGSAQSRGVFAAISGVPFVPMTATATMKEATCGYNNGSITVNVTGGTTPLSYAWNTSPSQFSNTATDLAAGNYELSITDANGCVTLFDTTLTQHSSVQLAARARPDQICSGSSTTLYALPTGGQVVQYTWEPGTITDSSMTVTPATTTQYTVTGKDINGCIIKDSIRVKVTTMPDVPLASAPPVCPDSTTTLVITNPVDSLVYNWYPMVSGGSIAGTGESFTTPPLTGPTSYYVEAVNGGCVSVRSEVTVTPYEKVDKPDISATTSASNVITFSWDAVPDATGYLVSVNGGAYTNPSSGPKGTTHTVSGGTDSVTLTVIALGALNCENNQGSYTVKLKVSPVFIPNAFTPNGDGLNDVFRVEGNSIATVEMMVFDQWGELLFKGIQWDGRHGGKEQPSGVYMYTVKVVQNDKTVIEKKGAVNLLR